MKKSVQAFGSCIWLLSTAAAFPGGEGYMVSFSPVVYFHLFKNSFGEMFSLTFFYIHLLFKKKKCPYL